LSLQKSERETEATQNFMQALGMKQFVAGNKKQKQNTHKQSSTNKTQTFADPPAVDPPII
jgi:hypothetical protein